MKIVQRSTFEARLHRVEANLSDCVRTIFGRCPELVGFSVYDPSSFPGCANPSDQECDRLIIDIGLSQMVTSGEYGEISALISTVIGDFVSEQPEALDLLRGRTFARTLH